MNFGLHAFHRYFGQFFPPFHAADIVIINRAGHILSGGYDKHLYAKTYQNKIFRGEKPQGHLFEGMYYWAFMPTGPFESFWILGLGHQRSGLKSDYPGGQLKLEQNMTYIRIGFRLLSKDVLPNIQFSGELSFIKGLFGSVKVSSPVGGETYMEEFELFDLSQRHLSGAVHYRLTPDITAFLALHLYRYANAGLFLGMTYAWDK